MVHTKVTLLEKPKKDRSPDSYGKKTLGACKKIAPQSF
jgi:hypothetical protein